MTQNILQTPTLTLAQWSFRLTTTGDVAVAVYIPEDSGGQSLSSILRIPPIQLDREVVYTVLVGSPTSDSEPQECLSKEIDQSTHQNEFVTTQAEDSG